MKRLALCLAIFMSAMLLTSCKGGEEIPESTEADGKQTIILARPAEYTTDFYGTADRLVAEFNSKNSDYQIQEQLYESCDNLFVDIYAGKSIDLLYLGDWIDPSPLYSKELLCDLYGFIDNDTEVSRSDYVESVLTALEINGKLYQMPYDFDVGSAVIKAKFWDGSEDMSFEHIIELAEKNGCRFPFDFSLDSYGFIPYITSQYIDYSKGECSFNDGRFEEFLEFIQQYVTVLADMNGEELFKMFINDEILLMDGGFASFFQLDYLEHEAGEDLKYVGYPSETPNYHIAVPSTSFAIFSQSKKQEGAFEFIKYCASYRANINESGGSKGGLIPINKSALEKHAEAHMERSSYDFDEEQMKQNIEETMRQINSVNGSGSRSGDVAAAIISEELQLYFKGDKSAAEVCEIIQNRLSTYFNEQRG
ncbi:MAG: extracellular solute-binding protein [Oscillospiraceae bacterium]|nr:extracellular solute-binding protein [Oscillospiraceae bacterium]